MLNAVNFAISRTQILINDLEISLPFVYRFSSGMKVTIFKACGYVRIKTDFGLMIRYDMRMNLFVDLVRSYQGLMCGLCGNFNGNQVDDLIDQQGVLRSNAAEFANSYLISDLVDMTRCNTAPTSPTTPSCGTSQQKQKIEGRCSLLFRNFTSCHKHISPQSYYMGCVYDQCRDINNPQLACNMFKAYALECKMHTNITVKWTWIDGCDGDCGVNEEFVEDRSVCENSCHDPNATLFCNNGVQDGCFCKPGFVRSGLECVKENNCGCTDSDGNYHKLGDVWLSDLCQTENKCLPSNHIKVSRSSGCSWNQECRSLGSLIWHCVAVNSSIGTSTTRITIPPNAVNISNCGNNEHYELNRTACQDSCQKRNASKICDLDNEPGCACNTGYVRNSCECVPISQCGCMDYKIGLMRPLGFAWISEDCRKLFICQYNGRIQSKSMKGCNNDATCTPYPTKYGLSHFCAYL